MDRTQKADRLRVEVDAVRVTEAGLNRRARKVRVQDLVSNGYTSGVQEQAARERASKRKTILLVQEEELFPPFVHNFPPGQYTVLFAGGAAEAMTLCEAYKPELMVLPIEGPGRDLAAALSQVRQDTSSILGISSGGPEGDATLDFLVDTDRTLFGAEPDRVILAAREMLNDRRIRPRVRVEFPVRLGNDGGGVARDVSSVSLMVHTLEPLKVGQRVPVEIGWGSRPYRFEAEVLRVQPSPIGLNSVVLAVPRDSPETRAYLEQLVRRVVEVEHCMSVDKDCGPDVRGPTGSSLVWKAEESILRLRQLQALRGADLAPFGASEFEKRYRLGECMATWGVGDVYKATHRLLNRPVWVKLISDVLKDNSAAKRRFEQEGRTAAALSHRAIVDILDFGVREDGRLYYAMEVLDGQTLAEAASAGRRFSPSEIGRMSVNLAGALEFAHARGVGHQDLCPANIFLHRKSGGGEVQPKLINFAGAVSAAPDAETFAAGKAFRPPEAGDGPQKPSFDVYALAAVLGNLLAEPAATDLPGTRRLREVLKRGCGPSAAERYATAAQFADALGECLPLLDADLQVERSPVEEPVTGVLPHPADPPSPPKPAHPVPSAPRVRRPVVASVSLPAVGDGPSVSVGDAEIGSRKKTPLWTPALVPPDSLPGGKDADPPAPADAVEPSSDRRVPSSVFRAETKPRIVVPRFAVWENGLPDTLGSSSPGEEPDPFDEITAVTTPSQMEPLVRNSLPSGRSEPAPTAAPQPSLRRRYQWILAPGVGVLAVGMVLISVAVLRGGQSRRGRVKYARTPAPAPRNGNTGSIRPPLKPNFGVATPSPDPGAGNRSANTESAAGRMGGAVVGAGTPAADVRPQPRQEADEETVRDAGPPSETAAARRDEAAGTGVTSTKPSRRQQRKDAIRKALILMGRKQYAEARFYLNQARQIDDSARLRRLFAQTHEGQGQIWAAIHHLHKALRFAPRSPFLHDRVGMLYLKVGRRAAGCRAFGKAVEVRRGYGRARLHLKRFCGAK